MAKDIKKRSASHIYFGVDKDTGVSRHISEVQSATVNAQYAESRLKPVRVLNANTILLMYRIMNVCMPVKWLFISDLPMF